MRNFIKTLPGNIIECFKGKNLLWQLLAVALTYLIVASDFDWVYYQATRNATLQSVLFPAVMIGGILPIILPLIILIVGKIVNNLRLVNTGWSLGQAGLIAVGLSSFYKVFTGRIPPPHAFGGHAIAAVNDISHGFQFGFLRGGAFFGWPSSHTTVAFAMAITLVMLYPKNKTIRSLAPLYALYIGLGVSISIHWFSEFIAGAIFGSIIGAVVGKGFLNRAAVQGNNQDVT